MFWLRHIEEVQLYLKAWFSSENSYVFTAATFMGFDDMVVRIGNIVKPDALENTVDKGGQAK